MQPGAQVVQWTVQGCGVDGQVDAVDGEFVLGESAQEEGRPGELVAPAPVGRGHGPGELFRADKQLVAYAVCPESESCVVTEERQMRGSDG